MNENVFMVTSFLKEFVNVGAKRIVALNDYDYSHLIENLDINNKVELINPPINNKEEMEKIIEYEQKFYEHILIEIGEVLNTENGVSYSTNEWEILLGDWLTNYISNMHMRYLEIKQALEQYGGAKAYVLDESCYRRYKDTLDYISDKEDALFILQQYSVIIRALNIDYEPIIYINDRNKKEIRRKWHQLKKFSFRSSVWARFIRKKILTKRVSVTNCNGYKKAVMVNIRFGKDNIKKMIKIAKGSIGNITINRKCSISAPYNYERRNKILLNSGASEFERIMRNSIMSDLPICFLEGFGEILEELKTYKNINTEVIFSQVAIGVYQDFALWIISQRRKGSLLIGMQHAANSNVYSRFDWVEERLSDCFITWGWGDTKDNRLILPVINFHNKEIQNTSRQNRILLPQSHTRVYFDSMYYGFYYKNEIDNLNAFLSHLNQEHCERVVYREYPRDRKVGTLKELNSMFPMIKGDSLDCGFMDSALKSKLVVVNYLGNTYMESIFTNTPTIIMNDPTYNILKEPFAQDYEKMKEMGILYNDAVKAADFINENYGNIEEWWNEEHRQEFVKELCNKYMYTSENAIPITVEFLINAKETIKKKPGGL